MHILFFLFSCSSPLELEEMLRDHRTPIIVLVMCGSVLVQSIYRNFSIHGAAQYKPFYMYFQYGAPSTMQRAHKELLTEMRNGVLE